MINLVLAIRSLNIGGAERQFIELLKNIDKSKFKVSVCTMYGGCQEVDIMGIENIEYYNLKKKGPYDILGFYLTYKKLLHRIKPDVVYSFMPEMNLFSLWCKPKKTKIIWGFRASNIDLDKYNNIAKLVFLLQKIFSNKANLIIANSYSSIEFHKSVGYFMDRSVVIPNGIDVSKFMPNKKENNNFREKYGIDQRDIVIGIVARLDPMKGYMVLSKAAKEILEKHKNTVFFSVGCGDESIKIECQKVLEYNNRFIWLGQQYDVERLYAGFDIVVSSSSSESFSNSIAEAMSSGCMVVVTDVGDSRRIVGDIGVVVEPNNVDALLYGIDRALQSNYKHIGRMCRDRILNNFSIKNMIESTQMEIIKCVE